MVWMTLASLTSVVVISIGVWVVVILAMTGMPGFSSWTDRLLPSMSNRKVVRNEELLDAFRAAYDHAVAVHRQNRSVSDLDRLLLCCGNPDRETHQARANDETYDLRRSLTHFGPSI